MVFQPKSFPVQVYEEIQLYARIFNKRFNDLPDVLKMLLIAKTTLIATAAFGITAPFFGTSVGLIAFSVTAVYVSVSVLKRLDEDRDNDKKMFEWDALNSYSEAVDVMGDGWTTAKRGLEDGIDQVASLFRTDTKNQQKKAERAGARVVEDINTMIKRHFYYAKDVINFVISL